MDDLKEIKLRATHTNIMATELIQAQEKCREAEGERDFRINELASLKRTNE